MLTFLLSFLSFSSSLVVAADTSHTTSPLFIQESDVHPLVLKTLKEDLLEAQAQTAATGIEQMTYETPAIGVENFRWVYDRGIGTVPTSCKSGYSNDKVLGICMENCRSGYKVQLLARWDCSEKCPSGYIETTSKLCTKTSVKTCKISCSKPKCKWKKFKLKCDLPKCSSSCPSGYKNIACVCTKISTKSRKMHKRKSSGFVCPSNKRNEAGLCYKPCDSGYTGVGPICTYTEWFSILTNLVKNCNPLDKNFDLLTCLEYVGDLTLDLMEILAKIFALLEKAINWLIDKIPFLKKSMNFVEKLIRDIMYKPIADCKKETNFEFYSPDLIDIFYEVQDIVDTQSFDASYINKFMPNFVPFMNCLKNKVVTLIEKIADFIKVADYMKYMKISYGRRRRLFFTGIPRKGKNLDDALSESPWNMKCPEYSTCVPGKIRRNLKNYFITNPTIEFNIQASSTPFYISLALRFGLYDSYMSARFRIGPTFFSTFTTAVPGLINWMVIRSTKGVPRHKLSKGQLAARSKWLKQSAAWYFDGVIFNFYRDWHYQYPWHKHVFSFPFPIGMFWQLITAGVPATMKTVKELFKVEDVLFIHFGVNRPCQDKFFGKWYSPFVTMSGFGFVLPLKLFGLNKWKRYAADDWEKRRNSIVPTNQSSCAEREAHCAKDLNEWRQWESRRGNSLEQRKARSVCDKRRVAGVNRIYFKCTRWQSMIQWYHRLKKQKNSFLAAVIGQFWIDRRCGSGYCAIIPMIGKVGNCQVELGNPSYTGGSVQTVQTVQNMDENMLKEENMTDYHTTTTDNTTTLLLFCGLGVTMFGFAAWIIKNIRNNKSQTNSLFEEMPEPEMV